MLEVSVTTLKSKLDAGDDFILLDVREPFEIEIASVPGALCIPMNLVPQRVQELDPDAEILVMCRSGKRSADITAFLMQQGFTNVHNVTGGILAWATDVDPTVQKYSLNRKARRLMAGFSPAYEGKSASLLPPDTTISPAHPSPAVQP